MKLLVLPSLAVIAGVALAACGLLTPANSASAISDVSPVLACVSDLVDAGKLPSFTTLEDAIGACTVAGTDVYATAEAVSQTAALPPDAGVATLPPATAAKLRAMPRRARQAPRDAGKAG
jgi:hypothetical protein